MNGFIPTHQLQKVASHTQPTWEHLIAAARQAGREEAVRMKISEEQQKAQIQQVDTLRTRAVQTGMSKISHIVEVAKAEALIANGINPGDEYLQNRDQFLQLAKQSEEELAEGMADGALAEAAVESDLLQAAIEDPELAAEIISEETGEMVTPEDVEGAVKALAEAAVSEEMGEPADLDAKLSHSVGHFASQGFYKSAHVLQHSADLRAALALQYIASQQAGRR